MFFSDVNADGRIIRPPTGMKPFGMQDVYGVAIRGGLQIPVGTSIPDYKAALAEVGCEGRSAPKITIRAVSGEVYECDFKRMVQWENKGTETPRLRISQDGKRNLRDWLTCQVPLMRLRPPSLLCIVLTTFWNVFT